MAVPPLCGMTDFKPNLSLPILKALLLKIGA